MYHVIVKMHRKVLIEYNKHTKIHTGIVQVRNKATYENMKVEIGGSVQENSGVKPVQFIVILFIVA